MGCIQSERRIYDTWSTGGKIQSGGFFFLDMYGNHSVNVRSNINNFPIILKENTLALDDVVVTAQAPRMN